MKVGDLVRFYQAKRRKASRVTSRGCLPYSEDDWGCGLVQDTKASSPNVLVLWPEMDAVLTDPRFLEVIGGLND